MKHYALLPVCLAALLNPLTGVCEESSSDAAAVQVITPEVKPRTVKESDIDTEFFEVGGFVGIMTVDDFTTEAFVGLTASFHATEDFFIQFNYGQLEVGQNSYEKLLNTPLLNSSDRQYTYYDFLVGYNIFPGEVYFTSDITFNSAFYLVAGVGNTEFAGEDNFTTTFGAGYRIILKDWLAWHIDYRDHIFSSDVVDPGSKALKNNIELSSGITFFF